MTNYIKSNWFSASLGNFSLLGISAISMIISISMLDLELKAQDLVSQVNLMCYGEQNHIYGSEIHRHRLQIFICRIASRLQLRGTFSGDGISINGVSTRTGACYTKDVNLFNTPGNIMTLHDIDGRAYLTDGHNMFMGTSRSLCATSSIHTLVIWRTS